MGFLLIKSLLNNMENTLEYLIKKYNITEDKIKSNALHNTENGYRTSAKELVGNAIVKQLFPKWKKVSNVKMQKAGADFITPEEKFIDIKVCIGPDYHKTFPLEIYQNDIFTFTKNKLTDYLLYIIIDKDGTNLYLYDYDDVRNIAEQHRRVLQVDKARDVVIQFNPGPYHYKTSGNGSGTFISYPVNILKNMLRSVK